MFYAFLAEGFEETEAIGVIGALRRTEIEVKIVGVDSLDVKGTHGIIVRADMLLKDLESIGKDDIIFLPGGVKGVMNLQKSAKLESMFKSHYAEGGIVSAICAGPSILDNWGVAGKSITLYPTWKDRIPNNRKVDAQAVADGNVITGEGVGAVFEFSLKIVEKLLGAKRSDDLRAEMLVK